MAKKKRPAHDGRRRAIRACQCPTCGRHPKGRVAREHRMFSVISGNWAGEPLVSYETILKHIRTARTETGFRCRACLDRKDYPTRQRATAEDKAGVKLEPGPVLPKWNYTIRPHRSQPNC